jgi:hypothetical protein
MTNKDSICKCLLKKLLLLSKYQYNTVNFMKIKKK